MTVTPYVSTCPWCSQTHELATSIDGDAVPEAGDITLCVRCGEWSIFSDTPPVLRKPTDAEFLEIGTNEMMRRMRAAWAVATVQRKQK